MKARYSWCGRNWSAGIGGLLLALLAAGCGPAAAGLPTPAALITIAPETPTAASAAGNVPPTWTPIPAGLQTQTPTGPLPSRTPQPTATPWPTRTATPSPTPVPTATSLPSPTSPPPPPPPVFTVPAPPPTVNPAAPNLLPNASFEGGWYNMNGVPELQLPNEWRLEWEEGHNPLDPDPWNAFVRPETRVLSKAFLPAFEHPLFIWDGEHTVKIFKEHGAISIRLLTTVNLSPGVYELQINVFPDLIVDYTADGRKIWAPDILSGEVQLLADGQNGGWLLPRFGQKNTFSYRFVVAAAHPVTVGAAIRGRWAIANNGWFVDDWKLSRVGEENN